MDFLEVNNIWMFNRDDCIRVASSCHRCNCIPLTRNIYIGFPFRIFHGGMHGIAFHLRMSVLPTPCSLVSQAYYKRKLSSYNFTVYSLSDGKGTCFLWNETEGYPTDSEHIHMYIGFPFRIFHGGMHGGMHGIAFHLRMSRF
jgi:hypothetical protein